MYIFLAFFFTSIRQVWVSSRYDNLPPLCDGVVFEHEYYEKQMLFGTLNRPTNLVMHMFSGEIFFSHTVQEVTKRDFVIRVCNVDQRTCKDLREVIGGVAIAYDGVHHNVYFGGRIGLYVYNIATQSARHIGAPNIPIWHILIHNHLYFIEDSTKKLWEYKNKTYINIKQFKNTRMDNIYISRYYSVYFSNNTGLYKCDRINKPEYSIFNIASIRQIVQHHKSNRIYLATSDGIYYVTDTITNKTTIRKSANIDEVYGMTFRNTSQSIYEPIQIIFSDKSAIFKLTRSKQNDKCLEEKKKEFVSIARQRHKEYGKGYVGHVFKETRLGVVKHPLISRG